MKGQLITDRLEEVVGEGDITLFSWSLFGLSHMPWLLTWADTPQALMASVRY